MFMCGTVPEKYKNLRPIRTNWKLAKNQLEIIPFFTFERNTKFTITSVSAPAPAPSVIESASPPSPTDDGITVVTIEEESETESDFDDFEPPEDLGDFTSDNESISIPINSDQIKNKVAEDIISEVIAAEVGNMVLREMVRNAIARIHNKLLDDKLPTIMSNKQSLVEEDADEMSVPTSFTRRSSYTIEKKIEKTKKKTINSLGPKKAQKRKIVNTETSSNSSPSKKQSRQSTVCEMSQKIDILEILEFIHNEDKSSDKELPQHWNKRRKIFETCKKWYVAPEVEIS